MFIVIETDFSKSAGDSCVGTKNNEVAIGFIYDESKFIEYVQDIRSELCAKYMKGITIDELKDEKYQDGHYLIDGTENSEVCKEVVLINKHRQISAGFFYSSTYIYTDKLTGWKYVPFNGEQENDAPKSKQSHTLELERTFLDYDLLENDMVEKDSLIGIIGKAGSGKTVLVDSILRKLSQDCLKDSLVITPKTKFYKTRYPTINVITGFDSAVIREYLKKEDGCIVIDDIPIPKKIKDSAWETLMYSSRKMRIITAQKGNEFQPKIRRRLDFTFYLKDDREKEISKIWNYDGQDLIKDMPEFKRIFEQMTDNFGSMVFRRTNNDVRIYRYNAVHKIKLE